ELDFLRREAADDRESRHRGGRGPVRAARLESGAAGRAGVELSLAPATIALPERKAALRAFDRASAGFGSGCVVHDEVRRRLLERLDWMRIDPAVIVDVGCATGLAARALAARYPAARVVGVDPSRGMLRAARAECDAARIAIVGGAAEALPLRDRSVGLAFASSSLPW